MNELNLIVDFSTIIPPVPSLEIPVTNGPAVEHPESVAIPADNSNAHVTVFMFSPNRANYFSDQHAGSFIVPNV